MTIKGSLYKSASMLKRFSAAENCPIKIGPKMAVFRKFRDLNINYRHHYRLWTYFS